MSSTTTTPAARAAGVAGGASFWLVAYAFCAMMAFSAAPTPLYVLYQQREGFGPFTVTVVFAVYAAGVVVSVFTAGHVSDWLGRRRVLRWALGTNMLAGVVFLLPGLTSLLAARLLSGLSIGLLTATATAYLMELHLAGRPTADRRRADLVATAANIGGIGLGPLIAGLLAEYAPRPLLVPYLVFELLLALALVGTFAMRETVERRDVRWRPQRVAVPAVDRGRYAAACLTAFASFAIFGLFTSLAPGFLVGVLGQRSHAVAGAVTFSVFAAGVAGQLFMARLGLSRQLGTGIVTLMAGLTALIAGIWAAQFALFLAGGLLTGAGAGAAFKGSVVTAASLATPEARGEALAGLFLVGYVGLAVPVLGLGLAAQHLDTRTSVLIFAAGLALLLVAAARPLLRTARPA
ncbi:MFS transporter [Micromonospora andamanensis]|uniref:MFS transporter n=1 Tax=Micromonospora andamanensis TaxID=1287068 RepID=A0ABQ4I333_9ACTN|nr:MFS transporter [Micromonospora andamanensis]GIJ12290.1 MFS transporter [Micromonospora andamanensis]